MITPSTLLQILDLARWAPSGDNTQPWRFEILDEHRFVVHGWDTRDHCVYDLDGHASQTALGALLETASIAASHHGLALYARRRENCPEHRPVFDIELLPDPALAPSSLLEAIPLRSVQRRPMSTRALSDQQRQTLDAALPSGYRLLWLDSPSARRRAAGLMFRSAKIRLTTPEAYRVHRDIIHWGVRYSVDRVPSEALGVDPITVAVMRFGLHSWQRVQFLNRFAAGTILPRLLMDWWPSMRCAAHFAILADSPPRDIDDHVSAGRAVQRFWLAATQQKLQHQPEITPLVFARYARIGLRFSVIDSAIRQSERVAKQLDELLLGQSEKAVWMGRIGFSPTAGARSVRYSLTQLLRSQEIESQESGEPGLP